MRGLCPRVVRVVLAVAICALSSDRASAGWELSFSDEFEGPAVDLSKWKPSDLWGNQTLSGNNEKQCYLDTALSQADGLLTITATKKTTPAASCKSAATDMTYVSGMMTTAGCNQYERDAHCITLERFSQAYGYFEIRAKLPKGRGLWPAFWLVPIDSSWPPEIDILEVLGHDTRTVYHTYHYFDQSKVRQRAAGSTATKDMASRFTTFGLDWKPGELTWYVDGKVSYRFTSPDVTPKAMYILINLAVGGHWPGNPDSSTKFPATMMIDYVRVYKRVENGEPDALPPGITKAAP